jgi:ubiquinone/menaquinone biosynthesis C-methylase UbiE
MKFIAGRTNHHIQWSDATTIILDVRCGSGKYISATHGGENKHSLSIGLDLDLKGMQIAKRNNASNKRSEFIVAGLYNLPFREQVFDGGTMWEVIEHIPPPNTETSAMV